MGRFTLRDEGKTIAIGKVIKYKPAKVTQQIQSIAQLQSDPANSQAQNNNVAKEENKKQQESTSATSSIDTTSKAQEL